MRFLHVSGLPLLRRRSVVGSNAQVTRTLLSFIELIQCKGNKRHGAGAATGIIEQTLRQPVLKLHTGGLGRPDDHLMNSAYARRVQRKSAAILSQQIGQAGS